MLRLPSSAELAETPGTLGDGYRENRFALLSQFRALGNEAQAVEVHVGAAGDRNVSPVPWAMTLAPGLDSGDRQRARGLEHRAGVFEHVLERGARRVGIYQHD